MNDTQLFTPTPEERLAAVRTHLQEEVEKREKAALAADSKLYEARELLETFDMAMKAQAGTGRMLRDHVERKTANDPVSAALDAMRRTAEEAGIGVSIKVGDAEPVTIAEAPDPSWKIEPSKPWPPPPTCDNCGADDCNLRQAPGSRSMGCGGNGWRRDESSTTESFTEEVAAELDAAGVEYERGDGAA